MKSGTLPGDKEEIMMYAMQGKRSLLDITQKVTSPRILSGPPKNGTVDILVLFSDQQLCFLTLLDTSMIIITPRSSNLVENFSFHE